MSTSSEPTLDESIEAWKASTALGVEQGLVAKQITDNDSAAATTRLEELTIGYEQQAKVLEWLKDNSDPALLGQIVAELRAYGPDHGIDPTVLENLIDALEQAGGLEGVAADAESSLDTLTSETNLTVDNLGKGGAAEADWDPHDIHKVQCGVALGVAGVGVLAEFPPAVMLGLGGAIAYCIPAMLEE